MNRPALTSGARRRDLVLPTLEYDAISPPEALDLLTTAEMIAAAAGGPDAPVALRRLHREKGFADAIAAALAEHAPLFNAEHGLGVLTRLLTNPLREVDLVDDGTCLLGSFLLGEHETLLAIIHVQPIDGHRLLRIGDPDEYLLPLERAPAVRALAELAYRSRFVPRAPFLRGQFLLGPKAVADAAGATELITATAAVEGAGIELLAVPTLDDTGALTRARQGSNQLTAGHLFAVTAAGEHRLRAFAEQARARGREVWRLEPLAGVRLEQLVSDAVQRAVASVPRPEETQPGPEELLGKPATRVTEPVTLSKEGNRGGHDHLVRTGRDCRHRHRGKPFNAMGADKKRKGAERVAGLPEGASLKSLVACSTAGCNLCWAIYVVPDDSTWPD
jgi:hypothetical protein